MTDASRFAPGPQWPMRADSRFVEAAGLCWHVQAPASPRPDAPALLLVHGSGASTHSWRTLAPLLQPSFNLLALDLPGHGFSAALPAAPTLPAVAAAVGSLLAHLRLSPLLAVGHSAGAAVLVQMALARLIAPRAIVSLNGALLPLRGLPGLLFSPLARVLAAGSLAAALFARRARDPAAVRRLVASTGSRLDEEGIALYGQLLRRPAHVAGTLAMMAHWDLTPLARALPRLPAPLWLVTGGADGTVPPSQAARVNASLPSARRIDLPGLGHLAHEEDAAAVAAVILECARAVGGIPDEPCRQRTAQSRASR